MKYICVFEYTTLMKIGQNVIILFVSTCEYKLFATTLQPVCDYFGVHLSMWTTFSLFFIQEKQFMSH